VDGPDLVERVCSVRRVHAWGVTLGRMVAGRVVGACVRGSGGARAQRMQPAGPVAADSRRALRALARWRRSPPHGSARSPVILRSSRLHTRAARSAQPGIGSRAQGWSHAARENAHAPLQRCSAHGAAAAHAAGASHTRQPCPSANAAHAPADLLLIPLEVLQVLHPLEERHHHAAAVGVAVCARGRGGARACVCVCAATAAGAGRA
jgi:hypothetical protein